jgi:hypothetical protein
MCEWPCSKFLALHCTNPYAVENPHPVHRSFRRFLFAYGLWNGLFVTLKNAFEFPAIPSVISVSKQFNGPRRGNYQETREDRSKQLEGPFSGIKRPCPIIGSEAKRRVFALVEPWLSARVLRTQVIMCHSVSSSSCRTVVRNSSVSGVFGVILR